MNHCHEVLKKHPLVEKVIIYGSRARGNFKAVSDIDLTLIGSQATMDELASISSDLDDLLLPYTTDLSLHSKLNHPDLLDHIRRVGVEFYVKQ